jgi:CheY-like chemotaxis protein
MRRSNPVEVLPDGEDVLRYLATACPQSSAPALLVLSLKMSRVGGMQVLEHLKKNRQNGFATALLISSQHHDVPLAVMA